MELYEAIEKRQTVRSFTTPAPGEAIKKIVLAGSKAASAGGRQPWEFIVIDNQDLVSQIADLKYRQNLAIEYANGTPEEIETRALRQKC